MKLYIINHSFAYELENLTRAFFPNEKIQTLKEAESFEPPYVYTEDREDVLTVRVSADGKDEERTIKAEEGDDKELLLATLLYNCLSKICSRELPWGLLTGVRPIKLFRRLSDSSNREEAEKYFKETLLVSDEKLNLAKVTEANERKILDLSRRDSFSLYISIPFCPSRCNYCSFVSQSVEKAKHLIAPYVDILLEEIKETAKVAKDLKLRLETVYIGGGTPTTLSGEDLSRIINTVRENFDMSFVREFTVEAGRPDTITEEKLRAIIDSGCDRLSINPQTLNDSVLEAIGRKHTAKEFNEAFALARALGFKHINTDLIAGLDTDTVASFKNTVDGILALSPESVTIHTLSMKRSSFITAENKQITENSNTSVADMLSYGYEKLSQSGFRPYYLYRQSKMLGNLENTGWAKEGFDGLYNVYIMDETHTILACGAGAVTKVKAFGSENLERIFNFKYPYEYIDRYSELSGRKKAIYDFYEKYF
ncbi:MAG: coproporphyrinogen dehydrogenase HemZ [Clostridia bacterium]|nr:coproporphyrinogen dehydrogenase HemZ [Clostridia bacterium]